MLPEVLYLMRGFSYSSVRSKNLRLLFVQRDEWHCHPLIYTNSNMTMSTFYSNEQSHLQANMNANVDERDDEDFDDETADQPLNRPKVDFTPVRDPLVAALFGPAVHAHTETAVEPEYSMAL